MCYHGCGMVADVGAVVVVPSWSHGVVMLVLRCSYCHCDSTKIVTAFGGAQGSRDDLGGALGSRGGGLQT